MSHDAMLLDYRIQDEILGMDLGVETESTSSRSDATWSAPAAWIAEALADAVRDGLDPHSLTSMAGRLAHEALARLEITNTSPEGLRRHVDRIAATLALHLRKADGKASLDEVVDALRVGRIAGRKLGANVILEVVLVEAVAQRSPAAMIRLDEGYGNAITRALRASGGSRAEWELEDLMAVIIDRPERYLSGFRGESTLSGWLARVAQTAWVSHARAQQREERRLSQFKVAVERDAYNNENFATSSFDEYEGCGELLAGIAHQALDVLNDREALMLRMVTLDGLSQAEFARRIGRDKATVTRWMTQAKAKLSRRVQELVELSGRSEMLNEYFDHMMNNHTEDRPALGMAAAALLRTRSTDESGPHAMSA